MAWNSYHRGVEINCGMSDSLTFTKEKYLLSLFIYVRIEWHFPLICPVGNLDQITSNNDRLTSLATEKIEVSSAKILAIDDRFLDKSLIYTKNNWGPKMDPWGNGDHEHATDHLTRIFEIYLIGSSHCILVVGPIYS